MHEKHNMAYTPEYNAWRSMRARCGNSKNEYYPQYGGRGIVVCERWRTSFINFITDMGARPSKAYSLERIDNDGPYSPSNCKWATKSEQQANQRKRVAIQNIPEEALLAEIIRRTPEYGLSGC